MGDFLIPRLTTVEHRRSILEPLATTIPDTVRITGLSKSKIYSLIAEGALEKIKVGRRSLVTTKSIHRLLAA